MSLAPGIKLGPYEILAPIGAGGMGEVYRARDARLNREVAVKVSAERFSDRFEREAHSIAALNHPNICTLYDVGPNYLVMELVEGTQLKGPLPLKKAMEYAMQILDALDAAHQKGITHRDLKPANILVTRQGIKLLDFGLAKLRGSVLKESDATLTQQSLSTQGLIVGTLQYISPEQLQSKPVDTRSDLFSFGCVLYEMLTGKLAFKGQNAASVIAAILEREPEPLEVARPLGRVVRRSLAKDPDQRFQTARDLKAALDWALEQPPATAASQSRSKLPWAAAGVLALLALVSLWGWWRATRQVDLPLQRLDVDLGADVSLVNFNDTQWGSTVAISPDGTRLAYLSGAPLGLFTRRLDQPKSTELLGTQGPPFFSPDGQWVGFRNDTKLSKISVAGGTVVPLGDLFNFGGASWSEDGSIIVSVVAKGLLRFPANGGLPETVMTLGKGELTFSSPQLLPGGRAIVFSAATAVGVDNSTVEVLTLADRHRKILVHGGQSPRYLPTLRGVGHLVYVNRAKLFAIPFDPERLETHGPPVSILDDVAYDSTLGIGQLDFSGAPSGHGTLVYRRAGASAPQMMTLQWIDASGKRESSRKLAAGGRGFSISPDLKRIALQNGNGDISIFDPQRDIMTQLTSGGVLYDSPIWSPDGQYVVFASYGKGMFQARADGAGQPRALTELPENKAYQTPCSFTPDGKRLAYYEWGALKQQIWTVPLEDQGRELKAGKPEQFLKSEFRNSDPAFSPDGRWIAYQSDESGKPEVYVQAFPPRSSGRGGKWQISNSGGQEPRWLRNGRELVYWADDQIMSANYSVNGESFVPEKPRMWIDKLGGFAYDVAPDGKRVVVETPVKSTAAKEHEVTFLFNFFDELRRRAPVGK